MVEKYTRDPAKEQGNYKIANCCTLITAKHISMFIIREVHLLHASTGTSRRYCQDGAYSNLIMTQCINTTQVVYCTYKKMCIRSQALQVLKYFSRR